MDDVCTVEEAAQRLKVSPKTIYRALERGELRASKIGRAWRIAEKDLTEFLEARMQPRPPHHFTVVPYDAEAPPIEEVLAELAAEVPEEDWNRLPADLTDNLDHYLYGTPRE